MGETLCLGEFCYEQGVHTAGSCRIFFSETFLLHAHAWNYIAIDMNTLRIRAREGVRQRM
jgi:hypothetical protein